MPTFWRSTELKICPDSAEVALADPTNGRFSPTTIVASSLSAVSKVGAESTLPWVSVSSAVNSATSQGTVVVVAVVPVAAVATVDAAAKAVETVHWLPEANPILSPVNPSGLVSAV